MLLLAFKASGLPGSKALWNWVLPKSLFQQKEHYRNFLVNKCLNLRKFQFFTMLLTYVKRCTVSCRMLSALQKVHFSSFHIIFHYMNGRKRNEVRFLINFSLEDWKYTLSFWIMTYHPFCPFQQRFNSASFTSSALKYPRAMQLQLQ